MTHSFAGHFVMTWVTRVIIVTNVAKAWRLFRQPVESVQPLQKYQAVVVWGLRGFMLCGLNLPVAAGTPLNTVYVMSVRVPQIALAGGVSNPVSSTNTNTNSRANTSANLRANTSAKQQRRSHTSASSLALLDSSQQNQPVAALTRKRARSWHSKLSYFAAINREWRAIRVSRESTNSAIAQSEMAVDYQATVASFTAGGNVLPKTQLFWELTSEKYVLAGELIDTGITGVRNSSTLRFERYKLLTEWFVETDLSNGWSLGADLYHSRSRYRDSVTDEVFTDKEYGTGLLVSKTLVFAAAQWRFDYVLSHRRLAPGDSSFSDETRTFHNLLSTYQYRWHFRWQSQLTLRGSYYPQVDRNSFWEATQVYGAGAELNYFPDVGHQLSLKAEQMWLGSEDTFRILQLNYEYQFGVSKTKRRKRQRRIPQLLIR